MRGIIITGGKKPSKELLLKYINEEDYIIGVDKGCNVLYEYEIRPNIILGDFDSANKDIINYYKKSNIEVREFQPEKDYTDTQLAYETAKDKGLKEILIFGATGSRIDHVLGNIGLLLKSLRDNIKVSIVDDNNRIYIINKSTSFKGEFGDFITFHALSDRVTNLSIKGGKYNLENYNMTLLEPRAMCNEFLNDPIEITFDKGNILVIYSQD